MPGDESRQIVTLRSRRERRPCTKVQWKLVRQAHRIADLSQRREWMLETSLSSLPIRHGVLVGSVALSVGLLMFVSPSCAQTTTSSPTTSQSTEDRSIRPFKVQVPQAALDDLRRRIAATRWPDKETVADQSQGAQLAKLQGLVQYWGNGYDWRKVEAKLNSLPQFVTTIDGVDIHFI